MAKKYRVFYHYYRQYDCMSVHWKGQCYRVEQVECNVPTETKRNKRQPRLVIQGFAKEVTFEEGKAIIT
jgi:hypothetical protein